MRLLINHKGPEHPTTTWSPTLDEIIEGLKLGHQGLLPLIGKNQEQVDFIRGYGLLHGVDVEIYTWGTTPWTVPELNHFYTYIELSQ